jgi:hypothetical protein
LSIFIASEISHGHAAKHAITDLRLVDLEVDLDTYTDQGLRLQRGRAMKYTVLITALALCANFAQAQVINTEQVGEHHLPEGLQHGALMASAGLEELAEDQSLSIDKVGAVLLLWNYLACDIYNDIHESAADLDMPELKKERMREKCRKVILLKPANQAAYVETARAAKKNHTSAISLAWAESVADKVNIKIIVVDDKNSCSIKTPGYGEFLEGNAESVCSETPWNLKNSATEPL